MSRRGARRQMRRAIERDAVKAPAGGALSGVGATSTAGALRDLTAQVEEMARRMRSGRTEPSAMFDALPRPDAWATAAFGPGMPLRPAAIDPSRPDSGRPEPRLFEYPVSWNLTNAANRLTPWRLLRSAADGIPLFRRCIEIRKGHMVGLDWDVAISQNAIEGAAKSAGREVGRADLEDKLRNQLSPEIDRAVAFLEVPDRANGLTFDQWLSSALEEIFVLDALAIYPRLTYGGDLFSFEILDGSTIKPLMDERGGRPLPPFPAYQQLLYGFPRGEFTADVAAGDGDGTLVIPDAYAADQLFYSRRTVRTWTPYGLSAVEQALDDGDIFMKRHSWMRAEYSEGTSVDGLFTIAGDSGTAEWSPSQLLEYEREYNNAVSGSAFARHRARFLPPGVEKVMGSMGSDALAEKYKPAYDLYLLKKVLMHFDTTLPEAGFTEDKGLGSEGYHEGQEAVQNRKTRPIIQYVEAVITRLMRQHAGMPRELEFKFLGLDDENDPATDDVEDKRQRGGVLTLNERRDDLGLPRYTFEEADMPMIVTGQGVVFLEGALAATQAGAELIPDRAPKGSAPGGVGAEDPAAPGQPPAGGPPAPGGPSPKATPASAGAKAKAAELTAYRRWSAKSAGAGGRRPFVFEHNTFADLPADLHDGAEKRWVFKGGDADPKAAAPNTGRRHWPGWDKDLQVAEQYAPQLSRAMTGAVAPAVVAEAWLAHGASTAEIAAGWLRDAGIERQIIDTLRSILERIYTEGYFIGDRSARAMLRAVGITKADKPDVRSYTDWGGWTPGDYLAAEALLGDDGLGAGLADLLARAGVTIRSIAANRLDELAQVLAQAADEGWSSGKLARLLRDVLDDPRWARLVAVTEGARASTASTLARYGMNGVEGKEWMSAEDSRVCQDCNDNELEGAIPLSSFFENGDDGPPAHPDCRCALAPAIMTRAEASAVGGVDITTEDLTD
jgi:SPP1 gp7 family putative phage head morphogenesis protein